MRLLIYLPTPGGLTGAPRRMYTLACGLRDMGVTPILATEPDSPIKKLAEDGGIETEPLPLTGKLGLRNGALFEGRLLFKLQVFFSLLAQQFRFSHVVRKSRAEVVLMRGSKGIAFAALGVVLARRPLIWDVDYELPSRGAVRLLHHLGLKLAKQIVLQHSAAQEIFGDHLAEAYSSKFKVLTPGIALPALLAKRKAPQSVPRDRFRILQVGTICDRKNQAFAIEILRLLPSDFRDRIELHFVGGVHEDSYVEDLCRRVEALGFTNTVKILGWRDDVTDLMLSSDLLLMPSKDEGVPNTVQEAMTLGLPVLASDRGGMQEIIVSEETGWILPLSNVAPWAQVLEEIMSTPDKLAAVKVKASRYAQANFGTQTWCQRYLQVISEVTLRE